MAEVTYVRGRRGNQIPPGDWEILGGPPKWDFIMCLAEGGKDWPNGTVTFALDHPRKTANVIIDAICRVRQSGGTVDDEVWTFEGSVLFGDMSLRFAKCTGIYSTITRKGTLSVSKPDDC